MKSINVYLSLVLLSVLNIQSFANVGLPLHSSVNRVQPMTGIVFWAENTQDLITLGNKTQLEFSYLIYSDVVEQEGVYDWSSVDNLLTTAANRGRQVVLRFRYTYPGETRRSVPLYITQESTYTEQIVKVEGSNTYIPDWSNESLESFTLDFYTQFAARYDNDPRLAFVQVGFGSYSEYHLYDGPFTLGQTFPSKAFQTIFLNHVNDEFKTTQWSISIDAAESSYTPITSSNALINLNYGLFDDSFLHKEHSENDNEYNRASWLSFGETRANVSVTGGELNYYSKYDQEHVLDKTNGAWGTTYETLSETYDITYMIGNDQLNYQTANRIEEASMANGYRYEVIAFSSDGNTTTVTIKNNGISPIYYDAYPTVNGIRSSGSLKGLINGESKVFTINSIAFGEDLTIECDRLVLGQKIQFDAALEGNITGTISNYINPELYIYPNPFVDQLNIDNVGGAMFSVWSVLGEKMYETNSISSIQISTTNFPAGIYIVKMKNGKEEVIQKIIKR